MRSGRRAGDKTLLELGNPFWDSDPRALGLHPNMPVDLEPTRIIERSCSDASNTGTEFSDVGDSCTAGRAEAHFQPTVTFVRAMLSLHKFPLKDFNRALRKGGDDSERARQPTLAEAAMADCSSGRLSMRDVAYCAARTATGMGFVHRLILAGWNGCCDG